MRYLLLLVLLVIDLLLSIGVYVWSSSWVLGLTAYVSMSVLSLVIVRLE